MRKTIVLLLLLASSLVAADEPRGLWTVIKPSVASDVTMVGESFVFSNGGYLESEFDYGTFVLEGDITPNENSVPVIVFSGVGENGGIPALSAPHDLRGSCFKIELVQENLDFSYIDVLSREHLIKSVSLRMSGVPAEWRSFSDRTFHFRLSVDCNTQKMKFEVQMSNQMPDGGMVTLLEYLNDDPSVMPFQSGRVGIFNQRGSGQLEVTGLSIDHEVAIAPVAGQGTATGGEGIGLDGF